MTREEAENIIQNEGLSINFGYCSVSDDFLKEKAHIINECKNLNDRYSISISGMIGLSCGGYCSKIDFDILRVFSQLKNRDESYMTNIAKKLELDESYVELIQYILCGAELCDYGTSPRGCFITQWGEWLEPYMKKAFELHWNGE